MGTSVSPCFKAPMRKQPTENNNSSAAHPPGAGRCRLIVSKTRVESVDRIQRLKLDYHKLLSTVAFNLNLRRYTGGKAAATAGALEMCLVGSARYCPPRHPTRVEPSSLELNDIL